MNVGHANPGNLAFALRIALPAVTGKSGDTVLPSHAGGRSSRTPLPVTWTVRLRERVFHLCLLWLLGLMLVLLPAPSARAAPTFDLGTPLLLDVWVDPLHGSDGASGATRDEALRSITVAWQRVPTIAGPRGVRIQLVAGFYSEASFPGYWENRHGRLDAPIILHAADGPGTARLTGSLNFFDVSYLYLIGLNVNNVGDVLHCERCDHFLVRQTTLRGGDRNAHETIKFNQSQHVYIEDSDISEAYENAIDFVAVQYGHIVRNDIHHGDDWCVYLKGGSAYFTIEGNRTHHCGTGGFSAGQGTGFEYMVPPWLHYEAYALKVVNNIIHDTYGAGLGVNGGYDILMAYNTLYRVGARSHLLEFVFGGRSCDGDPALPGACAAHLALGGWGTTRTRGDGEPIPNRHVYVYNNVVANPPEVQSQWQHFAIHGPRDPTPGSHVPSPARTDDDLRIHGNLIWNGSPDHPLGLGDDSGCQPGNPTCNAAQLLADNRINSAPPGFVDADHGDFHPAPGSALLDQPPLNIPHFPAWDVVQPSVPSDLPSPIVDTDHDRLQRTATSAIGALATVTNLGDLPLLTPSSLIYLGQFLVPTHDRRGRPLTWGGYALGHDPGRDALFFGCHDNDQQLAEIAIPALTNPPATATLLQDCADITEGRLAQVDDYLPRLGGTFMHNGSLIVSAYGYYDADHSQTHSHFTSSPNLAWPGDLAGPLRVGSQPGIVAGYMTAIPEVWRTSFGGPALTGQCCLSIIGRSSAGPAVSVFDPADLGSVDPVPAITALAYPLDHPLARPDGQSDLFNLTTQIAGVAFPLEARSVLFFGRHGTGPFCYDTAEICGDPADPYKGPHAYPYRHQVWAYDALDLASVIAGNRRPWEILPYAVWPLTEMNAAGSATMAGAAFDPQSGRIYLTEAYGDHPAVHVYALRQNTVADETTTHLSASASSARYGAIVTLSATVTGNKPTGIVTFRDENRTLGTGALTDGRASFATSALAAGEHSLTALYGGDAVNHSSTSAPVSLRITKAKQAPLTVTAHPPTIGSGGSGSILHAEGGSGSGKVRFAAKASPRLTCSIDGNSIRATGGTGTCSVTATKSADANYRAVRSLLLKIRVVKSTTSTILTSVPNPSYRGQSVTFTATVSGGAPTGHVTFREGTATLGFASLSNGSAIWSSSALVKGIHRIRAHYAGDTNNGPSTSEVVAHVVGKRPARMTIAGGHDSALAGRTAIFRAVADAATPTGSVTFRDGAAIPGARSLISGRASIATNRVQLGTHRIAAIHSADADRAASSMSASQLIPR